MQRRKPSKHPVSQGTDKSPPNLVLLGVSRISMRYKRPDPSTVIVYDHNDVEVLNMKFLNSKALSLTGIFRHPKSPNTTTITDKYLQNGPLKIMQNCSGNTITFVKIP
jgi:hypothetical protein